ncbi:hypothetical protein CH92_05600 [Stutzerimonas stutzeri]|uniref:DUF1127 domain-containing protein n=1 Tax=Stutzerimonas stutzeri TaxID=316 RepID=W8R526_STUST|nr:hypothetical protein [Stutzerimonas stutzeri]AHL74598.1 hypothetical protein CH92_05600 [Stutzerimonas stutzeri]MCQ4329126.1 hypothetical protein [Stutzerimonas stutzeri]
MRHSERQQQCDRVDDRARPAMPDFYMPAMWPVELQQAAIDWFVAWRKRRLYQRLLRLSDRQLRMHDLSRARLIEKLQMPLRQMVEEQRCARGR